MKEVIYNEGPESDVIISSRVRLARNLRDFPFPLKMDLKQSEEVLNRVKNVLVDMFENYEFVDIEKLNKTDLFSMVEMHLISPEFALSKKPKGLLLSNSENISIMINEEDHIRIQVLDSGFQLENVWNTCLNVDNSLDNKLDIAFSEKFGYLTSCPTNVGTGMRVSNMLHLPALVISGYINKILNVCSKLGIAVRGLYGENSKAYGNMFQISNQITLGLDENEIINNVKNIVNHIIKQERILRRELYKQNPIAMEDKLFRSFGIFSNAKVLTSEEAFKLISDIRLGVDMGLINDIEIDKINKIILVMQSANVQRLSEEKLSIDEINIKRAEIVQKIIKN
ncbi:MAG: protein arginine kinase [Clostridiales bacterium]